MPNAADAVRIDPPATADASVIWLHGLGADGHDFEALVPELPPAVTGATRFVFPHAPERPVTVNGGLVMRAWYDVVEMDLTRRPDEAGIRASAKLLEDYVRQEAARGIARERIVVAGFSQGGAVALHAGLRHGERLAGIMALSTYLPLHEALPAEAAAANARTPVFMAHGADDPVIPQFQGEASRDFLGTLGYAVEWRSYPMGHAVCWDEIRDVGAWLSRVLG